MRKFISIFALLFLVVITGAYGQVTDEIKEEKLSLHAVTKFCDYNNGKIIPQGGSGLSIAFTGITGGWPGAASLPAPDSVPFPNLFNEFDSVVPFPKYQRQWFYPEGELNAAGQQKAEMWRNNRQGAAVAEYTKLTSGYQYSSLKHTRTWVTANEPVSYERKRLLRVSTKLTVDGAPLLPQERILAATIPADDTHSSSLDLKPGSLWVKVNGVSIERPFTKTFKEEVEVSLLPLEVVSKDRYLGGSITIPGDWNSLEMEFVGPGGENLGKYGNLLGGGATQILPRLDDILSDADYAAGFQSADQKVWFVRNASDPRKIDFYTCFESLGETQIKLYLNGSNEPFGEVAHSLTEDPGMAAWIEYTDQWIKGTMFPWYEDIGPPVLGLRAAAVQGGGAFDEMNNLARAALIPIFILVESVDGASAILDGVFDGFAAGLADDWKLGEAIVGLTVKSVDWAASEASNQINLFIADPQWRAKCFYDTAKHFAEQFILHPVEQAAEQLGYTTTEMFSSWENFKRVSFRLMIQAAATGTRIKVMSGQIASTICGGIKGWFDNFSLRMMTGAEQASFANTPWDGEPFFATLAAVSYTTGYISGYVTEQIVVGMGVGSVAKVVARGGLTFAGKLLARVEFTVGTRMHALKKAIQGAAAGAEFEAVIERGFAKNAREGMPSPPPIVVSESLENSLRTPGFHRETLNYKHLIDDLTGSPNIKKLTAIAGRESQFTVRLAEMFRLLGSSATADGMKGFRMLYERSLWFDASGGFVRDHFDELVRVFRPTESVARRSKLNAALAQYSTTAGSLDDDMCLYCFLVNQDPAKLVVAGEHPAVVAFTNLVKTRPAEIGKTISWAENAAIIRYERKTGKTYRRLTTIDEPDPMRRDAVDFINQNDLNDMVDVKGPMVTTGYPTAAGFFEDYATIMANTPDRLNLGLAAVDKIRKNGLKTPALSTTVVIDTFGLTTKEIQDCIDTVRTSGFAQNLFIFLDQL